MEERYIVSARKYRPRLFREVVGQSTVTKTLKNAIVSGHLAQAYLFSGPRGVGKTTVARILAKTINCENPTADGEPCNECNSCRLFMENRSFNIHELDAASNNKVEHIRDLIDQVRVPPQTGKYSVYIIDEVHMLTQQAFNAFLKTLEEPPPYAIFIMATTEKGKVLPTIISRCQVFDFNRISVSDIVGHLEHVAAREGIQAEPEALNIIARKADGALRDALSIFDQLVSFSGSEITYKTVIETLNILDQEYYFKIVDALLEGDERSVLLYFDDLLRKGFEPKQFLSGMSAHLRDLLVARDASTLTLLEVSEAVQQRYLDQARKASPEFLFRVLDICYQADITLKESKDQRLHGELALLRMAQLKKKSAPEVDAAAGTTMASRSGSPGTKDEKKEGSLRKEAPVPTPTKEQQPPKDATAPASGVQEKPSLPKGTETSSSPEETADNGADTVSLKDILGNAGQTASPEEKDGEPPVKKGAPLRDEPFDEKLLQERWLEYAKSLDKEKPRLAAALRAHPPDLPDAHTIRITVENKNLKENFERDLMPQLMEHLREDLSNDHIQLRIDVEQLPNGNTKRPYTPEEKYNYLKRKNPSLEQMRKLFDLDLE